jgi:predicted AAA+ superfamily ATPase
VEGGLETKPSNVLFIATSNRRHMVAERAADTVDLYSRDDANELSSLYARFGLAIGFYPLKKELYLDIALHYLNRAGIAPFEGWETEAENFAMERGGRSGRVAEQYSIMRMIIK